MSDFIRQSQVISTFGPGSMVDLPDRAVLIMGLNGWRYGEGREEVAEPRLQAVLRRKLQLPEVRLVKPPAFDERPGARKASIDARIFPTWFLVQEARPSGPGGIWRRRRLVRLNDLVNGRFRDDEDSGKAKHVVPVRFVCGCPRGHLDDLDWQVFAHRGATPICGRRMWLEERGDQRGHRRNSHRLRLRHPAPIPLRRPRDRHPGARHLPGQAALARPRY